HPFRRAKPPAPPETGGGPAKGKGQGRLADAAIALGVVGLVALGFVPGRGARQRDLHAGRAEDHFRGKEVERATAEYTEATGRAPGCALASASRAAAHSNEGDFDGAVADCARALVLDPRLALAYANRGGAYLNKGDLDRAISDCDRAAELDPKLPQAFA